MIIENSLKSCKNFLTKWNNIYYYIFKPISTLRELFYGKPFWLVHFTEQALCEQTPQTIFIFISVSIFEFSSPESWLFLAFPLFSHLPRVDGLFTANHTQPGRRNFWVYYGPGCGFYSARSQRAISLKSCGHKQNCKKGVTRLGQVRWGESGGNVLAGRGCYCQHM